MQMHLEKEIIPSPLNYIGGKYKLLPQILPLFPEISGTFIDLFCGGCNVGINANADRVILNDTDENLRYLYNTFKFNFIYPKVIFIFKITYKYIFII